MAWLCWHLVHQGRDRFVVVVVHGKHPLDILRVDIGQKSYDLGFQLLAVAILGGYKHSDSRLLPSRQRAWPALPVTENTNRDTNTRWEEGKRFRASDTLLS